MKVAVFVDKPLPDERPTGIGVAAFNMSLALSRRGLKVHYVCRGSRNETSSCNGNMTIHQIRNYSRDNVRAALQIIKRGKPNVVHTHSSSALPSLILGRATGSAVIAHAHGDEPMRPLRPALMRRAGMELSHMVVATSETTKKDLVTHQRIPSKKIVVAYNGVDVGEFRPLPTSSTIPEKYGLDDFDDIVLSIGTVQKRKGQWRMLQCMPKLLKERPNLAYVNVGGVYDPLYISYLEEETKRLGISGNVKFLSGVPPQDLPLLINSAKICVHLSNREGFGLAVVEEMACGKAVVAYGIEPMPEIIERGVNGILISPDDPNKLNSCLLELLGDSSLRKKLGDSARNSVETRFTWDQTALRLQAIYTGLVS